MQITGRAYFDDGRPAGQVRLRFVSVGFNAQATTLAETLTSDDGAYSVTLTADGPVNLEVRVVDGAAGDPAGDPAAGGHVAPGEEPTHVLTGAAGRVVATAAGRVAETAAGAVAGARTTGETPLTSVRYGVRDRLDGPLNLVVPAHLRPMTPEFDRVIADVRPHLGQAQLSSAVEDGATNDLTLLNSATSWDARLLAVAASADRLARTTGVEASALYGMMRAGLPADPLQLARSDAQTVERALRTANESGVVTLSDQQIQSAVQAHQTFAVSARRSLISGGTLSSWGDVLAATKLQGEQAGVMDTLFTQFGAKGDVDGFWQAAQQHGLPVGSLRTSARLAHLTLNNAGLMTALLPNVEREEDLGPALIRARLYQPDQWKAQVRAVAGQDGAALDRLIPPAYEGADAEERLSAYAADMARKVRISYPTQVIGDMVATDQLRLGDDHDHIKADVARVLDVAASQHGFSLGRTPVNTFLAEHTGEVFVNMSPDRIAATTSQVKTLARMYQVTPDDESMKVMLDGGLRSAFDITAMPYETFLSKYAAALGGEHVAGKIYGKAQQVSTVVYTFLGVARQSGSAVPLPVASPPPAAAQEAKDNLLKQYPTLETLFGSMDFCECDHCRSVLGPAAYLVNLLKFIDPADDVWSKQLTDWKAAHGNAPYPYNDLPTWTADGQPAPMTPYEVLRERRPDLSTLPLTCENTNTALPYLDIVNEIMEQYVAEGTLTGMPVFDTGTATSEDLIAEPANLNTKAYDTLRAARYPITLPFDLWLATVREFCDHFDAPLWTVLDALRPTDTLYPTGGEAYGRAAVFLERLGLPPVEQRILADPSPLVGWRALYGYDSSVTEPQALSDLAHAVTLADRLRVSYADLVGLIRTGFVNPGLDALSPLRRLDLSIEDALRYREAAGHPPFEPDEKTALESKIGPDGVTWLKGLNLSSLGGVLVLADPDASCGFETTTLRRLDGSDAQPMDFLLLNLFVRVWRRLGWPIDDLDRALVTFLPTTPDPRTPAAIGAAMSSALLGLAHLDVLAAMLKAGRSGHVQLLPLWADLSDRRYAELFLASAPSTADPAFDDALGAYLHDDTVLLSKHLPPVQSALRLTADEIAHILLDAKVPGPSGPYTMDDAALTMPVVSALHRYAMLARLLKLAVDDLIALKGLSGLDPFAAPTGAVIATLADDRAYAQTLSFVDAVTAVKASGLSVADLSFLFRHRYDPLGPHRDATDPPLALLRGLAATIGGIRAEHAIPTDPTLFTDDVLRTKLALVFPPEVTDTLLGMWTDTVPLRAIHAAVPADQLKPADFAAVPSVTVTYDAVRQEQQLLFRGVLLPSERTALLNAVVGPQPSYLGDLLDDIQSQAHAFFDQHLLKTNVPGVGDVGFLAPADFDVLFAAPPLDAAAELKRRSLFAAGFLPYLQDRMIRQAVISAVAADLGTDASLTEALLSDPALVDRQDQPGKPLLTAYVDAGQPGLTLTVLSPDARRLGGFVEVPKAGAYRFSVSGAADGTVVDLRFDHLADPLLHASVSVSDPEPSAFTDLRAGVPYGVTLEWSVAGGTGAILLVQGDELPKGPVGRLVTYPRTAVEALQRAHLLLGKMSLLLAALALVETEARYLLLHPADFSGLDLGEMPTRGGDDTEPRAQTLFGQFQRLAAYAKLRNDLTAGTEFIGIFSDARRTFPKDVAPATAEKTSLDGLVDRVGRLTRRDPATVRAAFDLFGIVAAATPGGDPYPVQTAGLTDERGLGRVWRVLVLAGRFGVTPAALGRWASPEPDATVARDLRDTLHARYEPEVWRGVVKSIADRLRQRRRDALVAHLLQATNRRQLEELYELFLVDPGTEPVVQTSRLRQAISSVQLFIQRCLLNLEPKVSPSVINADQWAWTKRYRFSEANVKFLLWPENWLEEEFRDDKTHLFVELEGTLSQSDLSNDDAEDALFTYLQGLDEIARLDVRATYVEQMTDPVDNVLHVVARTFTVPHKYFYRTLQHRSWTPWIPITTNVEGDHVTIAKWRDRVHIFWVTFITEPGKPDPGQHANDGAATLSLGQLTALSALLNIHLKLNWTQRFQGEWTPAGATDVLTARLANPLTVFVAANEFVHATTTPDGAVWVHLTGQLNTAFRLISRHAAPTVQNAGSVLRPPFAEIGRAGQGIWVGDKHLSNLYVEKITTKNGVVVPACPTSHPILGAISEYALVSSAMPIGGTPSDVGSLVLPFFVGDEHHTFHVEPQVTETTIQQSDSLIFNTPILDTTYHEPILVAHVPLGAPVEKLAPETIYTVNPPSDAMTAQGSTVPFGDILVGPLGGLKQEAQFHG
jgi:hypothetical protein